MCGMDNIKKIRHWFRTHGKMDFEITGKGKGKFITYKCSDIDKLFEKYIKDSNDNNQK